MKQLSSQEIDAIVRDVMRQMGVPSDDTRPDNESRCSCAIVDQRPLPIPAVTTHQAAEPIAVYQIKSRLVTMETLPDLSEIRRVKVPLRAIVTPAVQDELRRRGITLEFADVADGAIRRNYDISVDKGKTVDKGKNGGDVSSAGVLAVVRSRFSATDSLLGALRSEVSSHITLYTGKCLLQAMDDLPASLVGRGRAAVMVTDHPAAAICLANRRRGIRAIQAASRGAMAATAALDAMLRDAAECGANLLVIDPQEFGFWILRQIVVRFLKSGPWPVPDTFQSRLN